MLTLYRYPGFSRRFRSRQSIDYYGGRRLPVDVHAEDDEFVVVASVAGLKAEDLKVEILDDVLTLSGEITSESNGDSEYLLREIYFGEFSRSLKLPSAVEGEKAEAKVENGIITVRIPKAENARPRSIEVKTS
ncbi:MAG: Hsp20/alpha crystallin family protein [Chloroflexi bacterium]|nr:Hsp20/alpha crystallin family protein [Chloroflexota bacterium]